MGQDVQDKFGEEYDVWNITKEEFDPHRADEMANLVQLMGSFISITIFHNRALLWNNINRK